MMKVIGYQEHPELLVNSGQDELLYAPNDEFTAKYPTYYLLRLGC